MLTGVMGGQAHHAASWFDLISAVPWGPALALFCGMFGFAMALTAWSRRRTRRSPIASSGNERREPPWLAETLLGVFARTKDIEALLGDSEEIFKRDCACMSERRARRRYWAQVLRSLWPQTWQWINRVGWVALIAAVLKR
jgi:hypothetical protein